MTARDILAPTLKKKLSISNQNAALSDWYESVQNLLILMSISHITMQATNAQEKRVPVKGPSSISRSWKILLAATALGERVGNAMCTSVTEHDRCRADLVAFLAQLGDASAEVGDLEAALGLLAGERVALGEVVDDLLSLRIHYSSLRNG